MNCKKYAVLASRCWKRELRPLLIVALIMFSVRSSLADWNVVPSGSMQPTILEGDRIFVNKLAYDLKVPFTTWHIAEWDNPERGDVVIFYSPENGIRLVKRVMGVPGDVIELRRNQLFINGKAAEYEPLDPAVQREVARQVGPEALGKEFAEESVQGLKHPMMKNPMRPSDKDSY